MSFNSLKYDTNSYKHVLAESVATLEYQLGTPQQCQECFVKDPSYNLQRAGVSVDAEMPMIDVDSELMGITRKLSNNPADKYLPKEDNEGNPCSDRPKVHREDCNMPRMEYTNLSNPACNLRGTGWNRWEWLCKNPQANLEESYDLRINTRILSKNNHRPCIPKPIDQFLVHPDYNEDEVCEPLEQYKNVCTVPTSPPSVQWQSLNTINNY